MELYAVCAMVRLCRVCLQCHVLPELLVGQGVSEPVPAGLGIGALHSINTQCVQRLSRGGAACCRSACCGTPAVTSVKSLQSLFAPRAFTQSQEA